MIQRSFDAAAYNEVINHPSVWPALAVDGVEKFDVAPLVENRRNLLLMAEGGGFLFEEKLPGCYEVHTNFLPKFRGKHSLKCAREALHWLFTRTLCLEIVTRIPGENPGANWMARHLGFRSWFIRDKAWPRGGELIPVAYWIMDQDDWMARASYLAKTGRWFHEKLDREKERLGRDNPTHPEDPFHDRQVGASFEMVFSGQTAKGIALYNRWAMFAGYEQVEVKSETPLVVDIKDGVILVKNRDFEVLEWQSQQA